MKEKKPIKIVIEDRPVLSDIEEDILNAGARPADQQALDAVRDAETFVFTTEIIELLEKEGLKPEQVVEMLRNTTVEEQQQIRDEGSPNP